ncbi:hypothetical protein IG631_23695 [Alternaria alternata]|nr:hypothetical protein IG631_23695 [Alternaria alternata]
MWSEPRNDRGLPDEDVDGLQPRLPPVKEGIFCAHWVNRDSLWGRPYRPRYNLTVMLAKHLYGIFDRLPFLATSQDMAKV